MAHVQYTGAADIRILDSKDLQKAGVEGFRKTLFHAGQPTEVTEEVAQALLDNEIFDGHFILASAPTAAPPTTEGQGQTTITDSVVPGEAAQESTGDPSETGTRKGRASTT